MLRCVMVGIALLTSIRTVSFGIYSVKDKNIIGGISVFFLAAAAVVAALIL